MSQVVDYTDQQLEDWYVYSRALRSVLPHRTGEGSSDVSSKIELTHPRTTLAEIIRQINDELGSEIKYKQRKSRFVRTAPNTYAINDGILPLTPPKKASTPSLMRPKSQRTSASKEHRSASPMTYLDAAEEVLTSHSGENPMHYQAITEVALEQGLIAPKGLTPSATMNAQLVTSINTAKATGGESRFTKPRRGIYGLATWDDGRINIAIANHNRVVREALREELHAMDPTEFQELVGEVLSELGFEAITVTQASGDGGIDVRGTMTVAGSFPVKMAVQVKRWKRNIQSPDIQKVRGAAIADEKPLLIDLEDRDVQTELDL
jgi:restriction system protein